MRRTGADEKASSSLVGKDIHAYYSSSVNEPPSFANAPVSSQGLLFAAILTLFRFLKMRVPSITVYLVNVADGLQILLCFVLEMYLLPSALPIRSTQLIGKEEHANSNKTFSSPTGTLFGIPDGKQLFSEEEASRVGRYIIIILLGWIFKPLLACLTDIFPLNSLDKLSTYGGKAITFRRRLPWLFFSNFLTAVAAFSVSWALKYYEKLPFIIFSLMLCGIGLALSTSVSEAMILEKNRNTSASEAALGLSLTMSVKVSAVTATLGYVVFAPLNWINPSRILLSLGIYCSILAICFLFSDESEFVAPIDSEISVTKRLSIEEDTNRLASQPIVVRMKSHLKSWKEYLRRNSMLAPLLVLVILFAAPDLRIVLTMLKVRSEKWVSHLNTLLPIIIQLAKLTGVGFFQFGLYRFPYQQVAATATCVCFITKLCGVILLMCFRMGLDVFSLIGLNIFSVLVVDAFIAGVAAELVLLTLLLLFCRHCPPGFEATAISIFLIASQSGSFLSKLDSVWITSFISSPTSFHFLFLQALSSFFYLTSLLLLGMLTNPASFQPMKDSLALSCDPLEVSSLLQYEQGMEKDRLCTSPTPSRHVAAKQTASCLFTDGMQYPSGFASSLEQSIVVPSEERRGDKKHKKKRIRNATRESKRNVSDTASTIDNINQWIFIDKDRNEFSCHRSANTRHYEIDQIDWASVML